MLIRLSKTVLWGFIEVFLLEHQSLTFSIDLLGSSARSQKYITRDGPLYNRTKLFDKPFIIYLDIFPDFQSFLLQTKRIFQQLDKDLH